VPIVIIASILGGALWGVIPALLHAHYRTNETLFTLMMNYVATQIVAYYVYANGQGSNVITPVSTGALPVLGGQQYLLNVRMEEATNYLRQGFSVKECAHMVGYEDVSNFSKLYKKHFGKSPAHRRKTL
jgi:AraC-like DNA-binding protein